MSFVRDGEGTMKKHPIIGLVIVLGVVTLALPSFAQSAATGDAARGKQLYLADGCYACHGTTGAGGGFSGPKLAHDGLSPAAILQQLRQPQAQMPAYTEKVVPDQDAADIIAYIQSLSATPAPAPSAIAILGH
jgi:mono/diheme cytochrome c family protein